MNSQQRRADRRKWKYHVTLDVEYNWDRYSDQWDWCKEQWGIKDGCGWREKLYGEEWHFDCAKKATAFAIRWAN